MKLYLSNSIYFKTDNVSEKLLDKLRKNFRVKSPDYEKSDNKRGFSDDEKYILMYFEKNDRMFLPRGVCDELIELLSSEIDADDIEIVDKRLLVEKIEFPKMNIDLYDHQKHIVKVGKRLTQGTIQAGCGSGKTIALLGLIAACKQPALVIVPNDNTLLQQWVTNIENLFGIKYGDRNDYIGIIGDGYYDYKNKHIVVAMNQSIYNHKDDKEMLNSFGFVCMDECHMVGARTFRTSIHLFKAYYRFGATATLFRNDNLSTFIEDYCGRCFYVVTDDELEDKGLLITPKMYKVPTQFKFKVDYRYSNWYNTMIKYLMSNNARNNLIVNNIIEKSIKCNRLALVVSTRVNHCVTLARMLQKKVPKIKMGILIGEDANCSDLISYKVEEKAKNGELDVVFGVEKVKQGLDIPPIEDVHLVAPRKSQVDITQIVGRAMRASDCFGKYKQPTDKEPAIYDYVDVNIEVLNNQYKEWRLPVYEDRCEIVKSKKVRVSKHNHKERKRKYGSY